MLWSYKNLPELKGVRHEKAKRLFKNATKESNLARGTRHGMAVLAALVVLGNLIVGPIGGAVGAGIGALYYVHLVQEKAREKLRAEGYPTDRQNIEA